MGAVGSVWLRIVAALAAAYSAYIHYDLAQGPLAAAGQVTVAGLFVAQAAVISAAALWVVLRASRLAWLALGGIALASLVALVVTTYVLVPALGPLPAVYEPSWYADKVYAAVAVAVTALASLVAIRQRLR